MSGLLLIDKIKPDETVLDVGCGTNPFKNVIPTLLGIDPAFDQAHIKCTIEEFRYDQLFDVAFCLGSINFGDVERIEKQIEKVISHLKPTARIYWRCNPGRKDHGNKECEVIDFYPWSIEEHIRLSKKFGFELQECFFENNGSRIYAEWVRAS